MSKYYEVQEGDCISSIAYENGFFPDTIWNLPENAELKRIRKDPDVLAPGDIVFIPDRRPFKVDGQTGRRHRFLLKGVPKTLRIQFLREDETPIANAPLEVIIDDHLTQAKTDVEGWLVRPISPTALKAKVRFSDGTTYNFRLGHLDPIETDKGLQQRLKNLGFYYGPVNEEMTEQSIDALRDFQRGHGLSPTGTADEPTRREILRISND
jgi:hypothetical protein